MNLFSTMSIRAEGGVTILALLMGTVLSWYALGAVRWEAFVKVPDSAGARLLRLLLALIIGAGVSGFILQYINGTTLLRG